MVGKTLGHYEIIAPLGSGGMGDVYRALDTNLKRDVAIKVLPEGMAADEQRLARLQREAHLLASLNHPNIAAIYNLEEEDGTRWLVLELVEGTTLEQRLRQGPLPVQESVRVAGEVARALEAAHAKGIVHRDLKSANVMLDDTGSVKVLDFGIAKDLSGDGDDEAGISSPNTSIATRASNMAAHLTATGVIVGTAPYMSPEQIRAKQIDKRTDNWAFGCLMFELLTGRRPFDRETVADTLAAVLEHEPDWSLLPADTPEAVQALIRRCLQKDANDRLHDIADARVELCEIGATGTGARAPTGAFGAAAPASWWSPKAQIIATFGVLLAIVAVVGWGLWSSLGPATSGPTADEANSALSMMAALDPPAPNSIAVLPFAGIGGEPGDAFSEQLAVAVLGELSKVSGLLVPTAGSSFALRERDLTAIEMGERLRVATILDGTVRWVGDTAKIDVQLVDTSSGFSFWAGSYEAPDLDDIFAIQEAIARQVVEELEVALVGEESEQLGASGTENAEAWRAYLASEVAWPLRTTEALDEALDLLGTAIRHDPEFALAHAGLANAYLLSVAFGELSGEAAEAGAEAAIERALELDPQLGRALTAKAQLMERRETDGWEEMYERAIELDPRSSRAHGAYWWALMVREGATDRVRDLARTYRDLNPMAPDAWENMGWVYLTEGRLEEAVVAMQLTIANAPEYPLGHMALGAVLDASGRADEAIEHLQRGLQMSQSDAARHSDNLGLAYASLGQSEAALNTMLPFTVPGRRPAFRHAWVADIYLDIDGSLDDAVAWYENAFEIMPTPERLLPLVMIELDRGDEAAALDLVERAEEMDPADPYAALGRLNLHMYSSQYESGAQLAADIAESEFFFGYSFFGGQLHRYGIQHPIDPLGYFGVLSGRPQDSRRFFESSFPDLLTDDPQIHAYTLKAAVDLAAVLMDTGEQEQADVLLERAEAYIERVPEAQRRHQFRLAPMEIHALLGRADEAFEAMELALADGWRSGWWRLEHKPHFDSIRDDPRFDAMVERLRSATAG